MFPMQQSCCLERHQMYHQIYVRECGCVRGICSRIDALGNGFEVGVEVNALELDDLN